MRRCLYFFECDDESVCAHDRCADKFTREDRRGDGILMTPSETESAAEKGTPARITMERSLEDRRTTATGISIGSQEPVHSSAEE